MAAEAQAFMLKLSKLKVCVTCSHGIAGATPAHVLWCSCINQYLELIEVLRVVVAMF